MLKEECIMEDLFFQVERSLGGIWFILYFASACCRCFTPLTVRTLPGQSESMRHIGSTSQIELLGHPEQRNMLHSFGFKPN